MNLQSRWIVHVTLPMAQMSGVEGRLRAVLGRTLRRGEVARPGVLACALFVLGGVMALAGLRVTQIALVNTRTVDGVQVHARVWQEVMPDGKAIIIDPEITVARTPDPNQHWEIDVTGRRFTWGLFHNASLPFGSTVPLNHVGPTQTVEGAVEAATVGKKVQPFPAHGCIVQVDAELRRYDILHERVTFHGVHFIHTSSGLWLLSTPRPLSLTTASGIRLTLPAQPSAGTADGVASGVASLEVSHSFFQGWYRPGLHCWLRITPVGSDPLALPLSPLFRRYHQPVTIRLIAPGRYTEVYGPDVTAQDLSLGVCFDPLLGRALPRDLTFEIEQRVNLRTFPMSFTVPLETRHWPVLPPPRRAAKNA